MAGRAGGGRLLSLKDIAQASLCNHLDWLGNIGDTPYMLVRPVLCRATPEQLKKVEDATLTEWGRDIRELNQELWRGHWLRRHGPWRGSESGVDWRGELERKALEERERLAASGSRLRATYGRIEGERRLAKIAPASVAKGLKRSGVQKRGELRSRTTVKRRPAAGGAQAVVGGAGTEKKRPRMAPALVEFELDL